MLKKIICMATAALFLFSGAGLVFSNEDLENPLIPGDASYQTGMAIEEAQYEIADDPEEKIGMQNEYAERRFQAIEQAFDPEDLAVLLEGYQDHEQKLGQLAMDLNEIDSDLASVLELVEQASQQRYLRLQEMSEDESLPETAREGMKKALENQEMAMVRFAEALARAQQAREAARDRAGQGNDQTPGPTEDITPGPPADDTPGPPSGVGRP